MNIRIEYIFAGTTLKSVILNWIKSSCYVGNGMVRYLERTEATKIGNTDFVYESGPPKDV